MITVHEATCHDRWPGHSRHHLAATVQPFPTTLLCVVFGCSCGMASYGAPGHDGGPA
jgi:hypothetical protein